MEELKKYLDDQCRRIKNFSTDGFFPNAYDIIKETLHFLPKVNENEDDQNIINTIARIKKKLNRTLTYEISSGLKNGHRYPPEKLEQIRNRMLEDFTV
jgi:hypothetical protein